MELRANHIEVFEYIARHAGLAPRSVERYGERVRARFAEGWPHISPGRTRASEIKRQVDPVHLAFLATAVCGAPSISDAADAAALYLPMLSEAAWDVEIGSGVARLPAVPDPIDWPLGRFITHAIANQIDELDVTLCTSAPVAMITHRGTKTDLIFRPPARPDGLLWYPRFMSPAAHDRERALRTLRTMSGPFLAGLGALLREEEDAAPVRQRARDRLDDLRLAA